MTQGSSGLLIALSAGGENDELATYGLGIEHVEELMVRLATALLRKGHRLAFGGSLKVLPDQSRADHSQPDQSPDSQSLTGILIDATQNWLGETTENESYSSYVTQPETWPLVNYSAWPFYTSIPEDQRANLVGICRFENVDPLKITKDELSANLVDWSKNPRARMFAAYGLSAMREKSAQETDLRIMWGGRIVGAAGWMPGILQEFTYSCEHNKPVLILGGFGGCARSIAEFLNDTKQREFSIPESTDAERDALRTAPQKKEIQALFKRAQKQLTEFRKKLYSAETLNGIPVQTIQKALFEENPRRAIRLAAEAADVCSAARV